MSGRGYSDIFDYCDDFQNLNQINLPTKFKWRFYLSTNRLSADEFWCTDAAADELSVCILLHIRSLNIFGTESISRRSFAHLSNSTPGEKPAQCCKGQEHWRKNTVDYQIVTKHVVTCNEVERFLRIECNIMWSTKIY